MRFLFGDYALDIDRRELRRRGELVPAGPLVFDTLVYLIRNHGRVVSKEELLAAVWRGRVVSESTFTSHINAVRKTVGDSGGRQDLIRTVARRGHRFVGEVRDDAGQSQSSGVPGPGAQGEAANSYPAVGKALPKEGSGQAGMHQDVSFAQAADGVHLAIATSGTGPVLVKAANWVNHVEHDWQSLWGPLFALISSRFRLVRYDQRCNGLSDWNAADLSLDAMVRDLETVIDGIGQPRVPLLGISQGACVSAVYAARHPERVSRLVLFGGFAQGWRKRGIAAEIEQREAFITLIRHGWGQENPAFRQIFTSLLVPGATNDEMQQLNELQRVSVSVDNFMRFMHEMGEIDIVEFLPKVRAPTLVLHAREDAAVPFEQGLKLARAIPGARFVALESRNHLILSHEPAWQRFTQEIFGFLGEGALDD